LTQLFDQADGLYFFPLLAATEQWIIVRPKFTALGAALTPSMSITTSTKSAGCGVPFPERGGLVRNASRRACI
ncbi:MAG TPA: hypothetical protein VI793_01070, partial [Anaerolineales bacterium]|nr:hypothetical protein [Anaerolineales bacterium]